jgi:hypothetical protein
MAGGRLGNGGSLSAARTKSLLSVQFFGHGTTTSHVVARHWTRLWETIARRLRADDEDLPSIGFAEGAADHTHGVRERRSAGQRSGRRHRRQRPEPVGVDHDASERVHVTLRPFGRSAPVFTESVSLVPEGTRVSARRLISHCRVASVPTSENANVSASSSSILGCANGRLSTKTCGTRASSSSALREPDIPDYVRLQGHAAQCAFAAETGGPGVHAIRA